MVSNPKIYNLCATWSTWGSDTVHMNYLIDPGTLTNEYFKVEHFFNRQDGTSELVVPQGFCSRPDITYVNIAPYKVPLIISYLDSHRSTNPAISVTLKTYGCLNGDTCSSLSPGCNILTDIIDQNTANIHELIGNIPTAPIPPWINLNSSDKGFQVKLTYISPNNVDICDTSICNTGTGMEILEIIPDAGPHRYISRGMIETTLTDFSITGLKGGTEYLIIFVTLDEAGMATYLNQVIGTTLTLTTPTITPTVTPTVTPTITPTVTPPPTWKNDILILGTLAIGIGTIYYYKRKKKKI